MTKCEEEEGEEEERARTESGVEVRGGDVTDALRGAVALLLAVVIARVVDRRQLLLDVVFVVDLP